MVMERAKLLKLFLLGFGALIVIGALCGLFKDVVFIPLAALPLSETSDPIPDPVFNMILFTFLGIIVILFAVYYLIKT